MAGTQITMQRRTLSAAGTNTYEIVTSCTVAGTLPDVYIFLLDIIVADDPKDDTLNRVCDVADFTAFKTDRNLAVAVADASWRSSSVTLLYTDIEVANAAWKEFSNRINTLVVNYDAFLNEFETFTEGEVIEYPTVDQSTVTALKAAYETANTDLETAEKARDDKTTSCASHDTELENTEIQLQQAQGDLDALLAIQASVVACELSYLSLQSGMGLANGTIRSLVSASSATDDEQAIIQAQVQANDAYLLTFSAQNSALSTATASIASRTSILQTRVNTLQQQKNAIFIELNKCNTEIAKLQAAVESARETREAALADVVAVCPDFVP